MRRVCCEEGAQLKSSSHGYRFSSSPPPSSCNVVYLVASKYTTGEVLSLHCHLHTHTHTHTHK